MINEDFALFIKLAFYQPGVYSVKDLEQHIPDVFYQMCLHLDDNYPNNIAEYTNLNRDQILIKQIHIATMDERTQSFFYKVSMKFGSLTVLQIKRDILDKIPDGGTIPIEKLLQHIRQLTNRTDIFRLDIENLIQMYEFEKGKKFKTR